MRKPFRLNKLEGFVFFSNLLKVFLDIAIFIFVVFLSDGINRIPSAKALKIGYP
jgi:hypothetical protein